MSRPTFDLAARLEQAPGMVGVILKMSAPATVELVGHLGFDLVIIDTEHGHGSGAELEHHIRAADSASLPALVRVSGLHRTEVARALDAGAAGVIIPQVDSRAMAEEAVRLAHYPPLGRRGMATSTRAGEQGTVPGLRHIADAHRRTVVVAQIESELGVQRSEEILAVDGLSAVWLGLTDLTLDMGHLGDLDEPRVAAAIRSVTQTVKAADLPLMIIADSAADGGAWAARGANVLLVNLLTTLARGLEDLKAAHRASHLGEVPSR